MLRVTAEQKASSRISKEEWREYTKTVWHIANTSDPDHPAVFPIEIPTRLIKLFSFTGEKVLDPFAGTGTTAIAALNLNRKAVCVEQSAKYVGVIENRVSGATKKRRLELIHGDARDLSKIADSSIGLAVTSPPYWNKADYGRGKGNIGKIASYPGFLRELKPAFSEVFRVLAPGRKFAVVTANVNQHTDHGLLTFPLSADMLVMLREIGFVVVNEIIWSKDGTGGKWGSSNSQRPIFGSYPYPPNFLFKNVHEYVIVVAKPSAVATKGKTVLPYKKLMETD